MAEPTSREVIRATIEEWLDPDAYNARSPAWDDLAERVDRALFGEEQAWVHVALEPVDRAAMERMKKLWQMRHAGEPDFDFRQPEPPSADEAARTALAELGAEVRRLPWMVARNLPFAYPAGAVQLEQIPHIAALLAREEG